MTPQDAFKHGEDAARNGSNSANTHYSIFSTAENTQAWERGKYFVEHIEQPARFREELSQCGDPHLEMLADTLADDQIRTLHRAFTEAEQESS